MLLQSMTPEQEKRVKYFKRQLEHWREFLVVLSSLLLWEKPWFPALLFTGVTGVFGIHWYFEPSVLTTVSVLMLAATVLDFGVPALTSVLRSPEQWTALKEKEYEIVCESIVAAQDFFYEQWASIKTLKELRPKTYFVLLLSFFSTLGWVGHTVNNLILTYFAVLMLVLLPGLKKHKIAEHYAATLTLKIADSLKSAREEKLKRN